MKIRSNIDNFENDIKAALSEAVYSSFKEDIEKHITTADNALQLPTDTKHFTTSINNNLSLKIRTSLDGNIDIKITTT